MNLSYKLVSPEEVDALHDILRLCGQDMKDQLGLSHWVPHLVAWSSLLNRTH